MTCTYIPLSTDDVGVGEGTIVVTVDILWKYVHNKMLNVAN